MSMNMSMSIPASSMGEFSMPYITPRSSLRSRDDTVFFAAGPPSPKRPSRPVRLRPLVLWEHTNEKGECEEVDNDFVHSMAMDLVPLRYHSLVPAWRSRTGMGGASSFTCPVSTGK